MAKNTNAHHQGSADVKTNIIIGIIIAAVLALAVYAVYGKLSEKYLTKAIEAGEKEATVGYLAEKSGKTIDEYLEQYGLSGLSKKTTEQDMLKQMTMENYASYAGTTLDELKTNYALDSAIDANMTYGDFEKTLKVKNIFGGNEDTFKQVKETYGLDDSITMDSAWTDVEPILKQKQEEMQKEAAKATAAPSSTEAPAQDNAAADEAAATEAPADGNN